MLTFVHKKIKLFFQKIYCKFTQKKKSLIGHNSYGTSLVFFSILLFYNPTASFL